MSGIITNFVGQIYADSGYSSVGRVGLKTYNSVYLRLILGKPECGNSRTSSRIE